MSEFTFLDLVLMVRSAGVRSSRNHAPNLDLLKHSYDKDVNQLSLLFGFFAPLTIGTLAMLVNTVNNLSKIGAPAGSVATIVVLSSAMVMLLSVLPFIVWRVRGLKPQFAQLVRTYLMLDRIV